MMHEPQIESRPLRPVLHIGLPIGIGEEMVVLREVVNQARTDAEDLLLAVANVPSVDLALGDLLQVIAIDTEA